MPPNARRALTTQEKGGLSAAFFIHLRSSRGQRVGWVEPFAKPIDLRIANDGYRYRLPPSLYELRRTRSLGELRRAGPLPPSYELRCVRRFECQTARTQTPEPSLRAQAKQSILCHSGFDASHRSGMTSEHTFTFPRREWRPSYENNLRLEKRAQGMPGAGAPAAARVSGR